MSDENGKRRRSTIWREVTDQLSDHVDLAALELRYETRQAGQRLAAGAVVVILALTGFIVLQVAAVGGLMRMGLTLGTSSLCLSALYFLAAMIVYATRCRRDKRAGPPFLATQKELQDTLRWIQSIFS